MVNRRFRVSTPVMRRGVQWLKGHFLVDISEYDQIIGYRADDSYFSFARAFISNEISLSQLNYAMQLGKLGEQYVIKSEKAFNQIEFNSAELADNTIYYARRQMRDDDLNISMDDFLDMFIISGIAAQFASGVPKFVSGFSGTELVWEVGGLDKITLL